MGEPAGDKRQKFLVIDDHESYLDGTVLGLKQHFSDVEFVTARTVQEAQEQLAASLPDLVITDLAMPEANGGEPRSETGIQLLRMLLQTYPRLNIVVHSAHPKVLVRLKPAISSHEGGFTIAEKTIPLREVIKRVEWALDGVVYTPKEMRIRLEIKPEWLQLLKLAFEQGLTDQAIAEQMRVSERTVRNYWTQIQDALEVYPDPGKNLRIQTEMRARQEGLID